MIPKIRKPQKHWEFQIFISKIFSKLTKNHKYCVNTVSKIQDRGLIYQARPYISGSMN